MKTFKVIVFFGALDGVLREIDAIEYEGGIWLVPKWIEVSDEGGTRPVRLIRVDQAGLMRWNGRYVLNYQMKRAVFEGRQPPPEGSGLVVIEEPELIVNTPELLH